MREIGQQVMPLAGGFTRREASPSAGRSIHGTLLSTVSFVGADTPPVATPVP
jgi:hypothetical protein